MSARGLPLMCCLVPGLLAGSCKSGTQEAVGFALAGGGALVTLAGARGVNTSCEDCDDQNRTAVIVLAVGGAMLGTGMVLLISAEDADAPAPKQRKKPVDPSWSPI